MKNTLFIAGLLAILAMILLPSATTFAPLTSNKFTTTGTLTDTITNTEKDTIPLNAILTSAFSYDYHVTMTTISGTRAVKVYLEESNVKSGNTDWFAVDSITSSVAVDQYRMGNTYVGGRRHRLRVGGTTGTMSIKYVITGNYKRTN